MLAVYDNQMDVAAATGRLPRGSHGTWMKLTSDTNPADSAARSSICGQSAVVDGFDAADAADGSGWYARPASDIAVSLENTALGDLGGRYEAGGVQNSDGRNRRRCSNLARSVSPASSSNRGSSQTG